MSKFAPLTDARGQIDMVDRDIMNLIHLRLGYAVKLGRLKRAMGYPGRDTVREAIVLANAGDVSKAVKRIYRVIIAESKLAQREDKKHGKR